MQLGGKLSERDFDWLYNSQKTHVIESIDRNKKVIVFT